MMICRISSLSQICTNISLRMSDRLREPEVVGVVMVDIPLPLSPPSLLLVLFPPVSIVSTVSRSPVGLPTAHNGAEDSTECFAWRSSSLFPGHASSRFFGLVMKTERQVINKKRVKGKKGEEKQEKKKKKTTKRKPGDTQEYRRIKVGYMPSR